MKFGDHMVSDGPTLKYPDVHVRRGFELAAAGQRYGWRQGAQLSHHLSHHRRQRLTLLRRQDERSSSKRRFQQEGDNYTQSHAYQRRKGDRPSRLRENE